LIVTLPSSYPVGTKLFTTDSVHRPGRIRLGDINIDGYPDLIFVVDDPSKDPTKDDTSYGSIVLVMNQEKNLVFNTLTQSGTHEENRAYYTIMHSENTQDPSNLKLSNVQATSASFFDFDENG